MEKWIALGNRLFILDEVIDMHVQKGHLVITMDDKENRYECSQIVIHFPGENGNEKAKEIFDQMCDLKNATKIPLPKNVNLSPDIMKTFYGDQFNRELHSRIEFEKMHFKARHKRKLEKAQAEIKRLKNLYELDQK